MRVYSLVFFLVFSLSDSIAQEQKFQAITSSASLADIRQYTREAIANGKVREALAQLELLGLEAERAKAWEKASSFYTEASPTALMNGQLEKAVSLARKGLEAAEKASAPFLQANAISRLSSALGRLKQYDERRKWLYKGIEIAKAIPAVDFRRVIEASLYSELGWESLRTGNAQEAIEYFSHAVQARESSIFSFKRQGRKQIVSNTENALVYDLQGLAFAYGKTGLRSKAIATYEKGLAVIKEARLQTHWDAHIYERLGNLYLSEKDFAQAETYFKNAFELAEKRQLAEIVGRAGGGIGNLLVQTGKSTEAIAYFTKAIDSIESTRSLLSSEELRSAFFEDQQQTYRGMILAQLRTKNIENAFNYNERARSRAFLDILGTRVQLARAGTLLEHERALQARISVLQAMTAGQVLEGPEGPQLRQELEDAQKSYAKFLAEVRKENREQASLMSVEPLTLHQIQELLDPGITMLEYFVARGTVWLWVVEKDRVEFVPISIARTELAAKITSMRDTIYQLGEKDKFTALSRELYRLLIEPALLHVRAKELLIVPHDVLHYLPFQALVSSQGKYLIEDYPIYYLSSASLLQFITEKRRAMGEKVLAFGNPDLGDPEKNLEFAELEAEEIHKVYPQATVFVNKQATEEKSKSYSSNNDILHFATHAELKQSDPLSSAILLAKGDQEDGRLEVKEIFAMNLKANLVVLSGCETGLGKLSSGDELVGLTRAFIYAGTPSVVASLWKVDDSSTAHLMANFYRNLKTMSKVEALRQAQLELIRSEERSDLLAKRGVGGIGKLGETPVSQSPPSQESISVSTSHPYFWAPFILVGDGK